MSNTLRGPIAHSILLAALSLALSAQDQNVNGNQSERILSLENVWNQAEVKHDAKALSMVLADAFQYTDSDGTYMDRAQWLSHVLSGVDSYEQLANTGVVVHLYGNVAIVTGKYKEKLMLKGRPTIRSGRFTDSWIQQSGEWKCVASQSTLISP
jgi:hypothetical protein